VLKLTDASLNVLLLAEFEPAVPVVTTVPSRNFISSEMEPTFVVTIIV
jgi:hypothetical protein